jgi:lysozyme family protein
VYVNLPTIILVVSLWLAPVSTAPTCTEPVTPVGGYYPMTFEQAWNLTMSWEGGATVHHVPGDPGGLTAYGISQRAHPNVDIAHMSEAKAKMIARLHYWNKVNNDDQPEEIRWQLFDTAFNMGVGRAARLLQQSINLCRQSAGRVDFLTEDGQLGPLTMAGADEIRPERLVAVFKAYRIEHYLVLAETSHPKFIHGWLRRAEGEYNG